MIYRDGSLICDENHNYFLNGVPKISVTQLLEKHGLATDYSGVATAVLERKAELGKQIHSEIEAYVKTGEIPDFCSPELTAFVRVCSENGLSFKEAEVKASREMVAGTIDLLGDDILCDNKTTASLNRNYVRWQTSLYLWLAEIPLRRLGAIHIPYGEGTGRLVLFDPIPEVEINRLIEAERRGEIYQPPALALDAGSLDLLCDVERLLSELNDEVKRVEARQKEMHAALIEAMEKAGVTKYESDAIAITYVAASTRETVDSAKLKAEYPDVAAACKKVSATKPYVKVKIK